MIAPGRRLGVGLLSHAQLLSSAKYSPPLLMQQVSTLNPAWTQSAKSCWFLGYALAIRCAYKAIPPPIGWDKVEARGMRVGDPHDRRSVECRAVTIQRRTVHV